MEAAEGKACTGEQGFLVMKLAIIGANGQLGTDLVKVFKTTEHEIIPLTKTNIDVTDLNIIASLLENILSGTRLENITSSALQAFLALQAQWVKAETS